MTEKETNVRERWTVSAWNKYKNTFIHVVLHFMDSLTRSFSISLVQRRSTPKSAKHWEVEKRIFASRLLQSATSRTSTKASQIHQSVSVFTIGLDFFYLNGQNHLKGPET